MFKINDNYLKLPGSYLFSTIAKKVNAYSEANPDKNIIRLGIGDVTQPLAPAIIDSLHKAVDENAMFFINVDFPDAFEPVSRIPPSAYRLFATGCVRSG